MKNPVYAELHSIWDQVSPEERVQKFNELAPADAEEFFRELSARDDAELLLALPEREQRLWLRVLDPDDAADLIQEVPEEKEHLLSLLDSVTRAEVSALLAYNEDVAGGLMNPRFARVRSDMTVGEAISYLRNQAAEHAGILYYIYVLDADQHLQGVVSLRKLLSEPTTKPVSKIMRSNVIWVKEDVDQEELSRLFGEHNLIAIPVIDEAGCMKGIVTVDDVMDAVEEEATEDMQKMGGSEALEGPYLRVGLAEMIRARAGWLTVLFIGEMLTANAMGYFEGEIARAVILTLFLPLIISSGGNAGSQASTLVIRAMALGEVRLTDWWKVLRRELVTGSVLGIILGIIGILRVTIWEQFFHVYGEHYLRIALVVGISLVGIVLWGSVCGSLLPLALRKIGFDPASASTPFVATLVDVTGVIIYFGTASILLRGFLL